MYVCVKGAILGLSHANQVPVKSVPDGPKATPALKVIVYSTVIGTLTYTANQNPVRLTGADYKRPMKA